MAQTKIALTAPQTIPLDKLTVHEGNVRQIKSGVSIENLAADIARRGLLQSLSVRPVLNDVGEETGQYGVQAGSRRLRALQLLVKQKKLAKNAPVPCIVRTEGYVEADSLAENTEREALHPIDQFRAFAALREKGEGEETIAAAFGVTPAVVKQRLRLAKASPVLLTAYENDEISLEQLMAFCLVDDHLRQEDVLALLKNQWNKGPDTIRRLLTEKAVRANDRRALFVGQDAYERAGGIILRDLFDEDHGGWLQNMPLLERLVMEQLTSEAETVKAEGWGWVETAIDFPWNYQRNYRPLKPSAPALTKEEEAQVEALSAELEELEYLDDDEHTEETAVRVQTLKALLTAYENKSPVFDEAQKAKAGALISLNNDGFVLIERGFMRLEDIETSPHAQSCGITGGADDETDPPSRPVTANTDAETEDDDTGAALPDRLLVELTAYRSLALRDALANDHDWAYLAVLHALTLRLFYRYSTDTCLQIEGRDLLTQPFAGLETFMAGRSVAVRHKAWVEVLPENTAELWDALVALTQEERHALFAHCAGLTVNAVHEPRAQSTGRKRHADQLASAIGLDMGQAGWITRADNYLGRVTKSKIVEAVREAKGDKMADLLADLKKKEMAQEAERLLDGTGWLPEPLRTEAALEETSAPILPAFLDDGELEAAK